MVEGLGNGNQELDEPSGGQRLGLEDLGKVSALDVFEYDEHAVFVVTTDVIDPDDRRMTEPCGEAGLPEEGIDLLGQAQQSGTWNLDRDEAIQLEVAGEVYAAKPTPPERPDHRVATEARGSGIIRRGVRSIRRGAVGDGCRA
jgi:hypothetical protein